MQLRSILGMLLQSSELWRNQVKYPQHQQQKGDLTWVFGNIWLDRGLQVEYIWFIYYDFIIFSFLTDYPILRYLCVFQRYIKRAYLMFSSPFLPTGSKMDGAETGVLCPGMCEGGWPATPLGALTACGSSGAGSTSLSEFNTVLIN